LLFGDGSTFSRHQTEGRHLSDDISDGDAVGKKFECLSDKRRTLRVNDNPLCRGLIQVSDWRNPQPPALVDTGLHTKFSFL